MKRIFATWLMDIAKYVVTALVLSTALTDFVTAVPAWIFYIVCFGIVMIIVLFGFLLFRSADKDDKKKQNV